MIVTVLYYSICSVVPQCTRYTVYSDTLYSMIVAVLYYSYSICSVVPWKVKRFYRRLDTSPTLSVSVIVPRSGRHSPVGERPPNSARSKVRAICNTIDSVGLSSHVNKTLHGIQYIVE